MDNESYLEIDKFGSKFWTKKGGILHRLDGPAIEYFYGTKQWYQHGALHRLDGPAAEYADGSKEWYQNGVLHRLDGPAHINKPFSIKAWYKNGRKFKSKDTFFRALSKKEKELALFSEDFLNA
jgi:hypothetical protein